MTNTRNTRTRARNINKHARTPNNRHTGTRHLDGAESTPTGRTHEMHDTTNHSHHQVCFHIAVGIHAQMLLLSSTVKEFFATLRCVTPCQPTCQRISCGDRGCGHTWVRRGNADESEKVNTCTDICEQFEQLLASGDLRHHFWRKLTKLGTYRDMYKGSVQWCVCK